METKQIRERKSSIPIQMQQLYIINECHIIIDCIVLKIMPKQCEPHDSFFFFFFFKAMMNL